MKRALLLAAGHATRLAGLRQRYAKAAVPIAGTTALTHLLQSLAQAGVEECWVNLHHHAKQVRKLAEHSAPPGLRVQFLEEPALLGTGGTLLEVAQRCGEAPEWMINAKIFTDFRFARLDKDPPGTLVLHTASCLREFGGLRYDAAAFFLGLQPRGSDPQTSPQAAAVYTGICKIDPAWITALEHQRGRDADGVLCLLRHGLLPAVADGHRAHVHLHDGFWCEISTPERVAAAARAVAAAGLSPAAQPDP